MVWLVLANPMQYTLVDLPLSTLAPGCERGATVPSNFVDQVARITVICAVLNGASPYLGLKTQYTWSLFSNLRVEDGVSNHLFIPASSQLFGYTGECVTVMKTNVPALKEHHTVMGGVSRLRIFRSFVER